MKNIVRNRKSEHGGAGIKFLAILAVLLMVANAGYNYVPIAYEGENFKQEMQTAVVAGLASVGQAKPMDNVKARLVRAASANNLPPDAYMDVKQVGAVVQAHVVYTKSVAILPFGIYDHQYHFDHTATPAGFLLKDK